MVGSPNFVRFVYDGDNSAFPAGVDGVAAGPPGSGLIESVFTDYFDSQGLESEPTPFNGRSDYGPSSPRVFPPGAASAHAAHGKSGLHDDSDRENK